MKTLSWAVTPFIIVALALAVLGVGQYIRQHQSSRTGSTGGAATKATAPTSNSNSGSKIQNSSPRSIDTSSKGDASSVNQTGILIAPWGTFANVYKARTSDQMGSTCNTTSGATCSITFTNGGTTRSLPSEVTDAGGTAYWSWKPQDIGLTLGTWQITAEATLGSQTKTTSNDPLTLEIMQ